MTCAEAVRLYLLTLSPVTALVVGRVFTFRFPQDMTASSFPAVLVQQVSDVRSPHLRGTSGLNVARVQVSCVAKTVSAARTLEQAVLGEFVNGAPTGLQGATGGVGSPALTFQFVDPIGYREFYEADELKQAWVVRDYRVSYSE